MNEQDIQQAMQAATINDLHTYIADREADPSLRLEARRELAEREERESTPGDILDLS